MILFPHMLVGAAIGSKVKNPGAILVIASFLHFLFDRFPHLEYFKRLPLNQISIRNLSILSIVAVIDLMVGYLIIWMFLKESMYSYRVLMGVVISILPDGLVFLYISMRGIFNFENKILKKFYSFHNSIHIQSGHNSPLSGFLIESAIITLSIFLILYRG
jgi:hypothetical protein